MGVAGQFGVFRSNAIDQCVILQNYSLSGFSQTNGLIFDAQNASSIFSGQTVQPLACQCLIAIRY